MKMTRFLPGQRGGGVDGSEGGCLMDSLVERSEEGFGWMEYTIVLSPSYSKSM